jgi:S1-C subfamily serine protease
MTKIVRQTSTRVPAIALAVLLATPSARAEWVVVHRLNTGAVIKVDTDSVQRSGKYIRYRIRQPAWSGEYTEEDVVADCVERKRGSWSDFRFYSVYSDTRNGNEVAVACAYAERQGIVPKELAQAAPTTPPELSTPEAQTPAPEPVKMTSYSGTGFYINSSMVVTNYHVVEQCSKFRVLRDGAEFSAAVAATDKRNDLALLQVVSPPAASPALRTSAALGEEIMVAGHPLTGLLGNDIIVTSGQVNSMAGLGNDPTFIQISAPVQSGNSGGPVIDRTGNVVGVVVAKVNVLKVARLTGDMAQNINFAIKPEVLRLFLEANRVIYRSAATGKKQERLESTDLAQRARGFTVQVVCTS